jgi:D-glycero-D-manno-heptose 1,7-bisphosphate phosphatase
MADIGKRPLAAVIFDRDGVLNVDHGYVGEAERLEWMPGAKRAIRRLNESGIRVIVATNQSGVARGYFDEAAVARVHEVMRADLAAIGGRLDEIYVCPFHPCASVPAFAHPDHPGRKPNPGMILEAMADHGLAPDEVVVVGDKESDMEAARRAGVAGIRFDGGDLERFLTDLGILK